MSKVYQAAGGQPGGFPGGFNPGDYSRKTGTESTGPKVDEVDWLSLFPSISILIFSEN